MNAWEAKTWEKIRQFQLDDEKASFKFSERLARENGWTKAYTLRVIEEYKKFIFLCSVCEEGVTPSDAVDQAWHLHLTFTKSYWVDLCRNTIGKELHHNPTQGGTSEAKKFNHFYSSSHDRYKEYFGTEPPADIWPDHQKRFSDIDFQRVNLGKFWLIRKPALRHKPLVITVCLCACLILFVQAVDLPGRVILSAMLGLILYSLIGERKPGKRTDNDSGGGHNSGGYYGGDSGSHHHGGSSHDGHGGHGCSSGCSGCSSSGCSGCSSGCGGGH